MTRKSDQDSQNAGWVNRLAFLDGIASSENESILQETDEDDEDVLVPIPKKARSRRRRPTAASARLSTRRQAAKARAQKKRPKAESPSAKARADVKTIVGRLRDEAIRKAMPGIALFLYRESRQLINELTSDSSPYDQQKARWALQAAIDAFEISERYSDAAEVLIFLARWVLRVQPGTPIKGFIEQARGYLDPDNDRKLLSDCDELELLCQAIHTHK